ncbi:MULTISPECIES: site-specific integrase [Vibrio]|uniref:site-specific integrase n=3 Tax=Vibrionaceae TaxID=641 RepID=UPI001593903C|nr:MULTISPECIES: site-specific integrase [Vibrio]MBO0211069.1 site-specific integrase [Vibrio sp. Vb0877]QKS94810.1 site-specific integrase [Vibrio alginolyticus]
MVLFVRDTITRPNTTQGSSSQKALAEKWAVDVLSWSKERLLEIPLSRAEKGVPGIIPYASHCLRISVASLSRWKYFFRPIQQKMIETGCYFPEFSIYANEYNRRLVLFLRDCDSSQYPHETPFQTKLKIKEDAGIPRYLQKGARALVNRTLDEYFSQLQQHAGVEGKDNSSRREQAEISKETRKKNKLLNTLRGIAVTHSDDLVTATKAEPYLPFKHLFYHGTINTSYGRAEFETYIEPYLGYIGINSSSSLHDVFHTYSLTRFKKFQEENVISKKFSTRAANAAISAFRLFLNRFSVLQDQREFKFIDVIGFKNVRATEQRTPFSINSRYDLIECIDSTLNDIDSKTLVVSEDKYKEVDPFYHPLLNCIIEHMGGCYALRDKDSSDKFSIECAKLARARAKDENWYGNSLRQDALHSIGIIPEIDSYLMYVFMMKLAAVTGMNREAIVDLEIDDFVWNHPATGKPCIRYWKVRSLGQKRLHLDLIDAEIQWMTIKQGQEVRWIFDKVTKLTEPFRKYASESNINRLFIFRHKSRKIISIRSFRDERSFDNASAVRFVKNHNLRDDNGDFLEVNISKFRATFVSEHIEAGVSIREMQLLLGHRSITTTIDYLDRMDFDRFARKKVNEALKKIHSKCITSPKKANKHTDKNKPEEIPITTVSTGLVACVNVMDPPEFIRNLPNYVEGQPCSLFNKCLVCDNCLITRDHLPMLFAQQREFLNLLNNSKILNTPYHSVIKQNTALLNEVLGENSDFDIDIRKEAELLSLHIELSNGALM